MPLTDSNGIDHYETGLLTFCHLQKGHFRQLKRLHQTVNTMWDDAINSLVEEQHTRVATIEDEEERQWTAESYSHDIVDRIQMEEIHQRALLTALQSQLERSLFGLCRLIAETHKLAGRDSTPLEEFKTNKGIKRGLSYLTKVAQFELSGIAHSRNIVMDVQQVRNHITHNHHEITTAALASTIGKHPTWFEGKQGDTLQITPLFAPEYVKEIDHLFDALQEQVITFIAALSTDST
ncbi:hypothetical protein [Aliagarivorans taiwanensis]|uniref:hypothetical protein n=1 Tax=Aliagarivorans taiwanensis TaxID=561966 RepID=UPI00047E5590|nr:hypothetical protein [Aliagarivorans taiwanensis]